MGQQAHPAEHRTRNARRSKALASTVAKNAMIAPILAEAVVSNTFVVIACIAIVIQALVLFVAFFDPGLRYKIRSPQALDLESEPFLFMIEALTDSKLNRQTGFEVFTNGENFYEAELKAIAAGRSTINLEAYIFTPGKVTGRFVQALAERGRAGVRVNVLLDALGSASTTKHYLRELMQAGGNVAFYNAVRWNRLPRYNNRTHRELIVIDGRVAFIGGAGFADHWFEGKKGHRRWRDTMVRVEGDAVPNLQATFSENWLEAYGEIIAGPEYFPLKTSRHRSTALVVNGTPSAGGSTRARILFQTLIASAKHNIAITTPYFLPDKSLSEEIVRALGRGVRVKIITPGKHSDHMLTRSSSTHSYGRLLQAGAQIYEYQPTMIHAKILIIDDLWTVVGSTNFDNRSFGLNDEVNLAVFDRSFAARLQQDFAHDLAESREITYDRWRQRSIFARAPELVGWVFERQQ